MLGPMYPAILESWVPSSHLLPPSQSSMITTDLVNSSNSLKLIFLIFFGIFLVEEREVSRQETGNPGQWGLRE